MSFVANRRPLCQMERGGGHLNRQLMESPCYLTRFSIIRKPKGSSMKGIQMPPAPSTSMLRTDFRKSVSFTPHISMRPLTKRKPCGAQSFATRLASGRQRVIFRSIVPASADAERPKRQDGGNETAGGGGAKTIIIGRGPSGKSLACIMILRRSPNRAPVDDRVSSIPRGPPGTHAVAANTMPSPPDRFTFFCSQTCTSNHPSR